MRLLRWTRLAAGLLLAMGCAATGAGGGRAESCVPCELEEGDRAEITAVQASLEEVQAGPSLAVTGTDREFQLSAWYLDADQKVVSGRFDPFVWELDPATSGSVTPFGLVTLNFSATSDVIARVRNDAGTLADQITLKRWPDAATPGVSSDVVNAEHGPKGPPNTVLLEERTAQNTCVWGRARAFAGIAAVGQQSGTPCSFSLLSADHAMVYQDGIATASWTNPYTPLLAAPLDLDVTVFIAVTGRTASQLSGSALASDILADAVAAGAAAQAALDATWANVVFEANRVGIRINVKDIETLDPATPNLAKLVGAHPFKCSNPRGLTAFDPNNPTAPYQYNKDAISVYYVDWIDYPADPRHAGARGVHCHFWYQGTPGPVIFISYTKHSTITLAHEIGHALGLVDEEENLGVINVMHNLAPDGPLGADARSRFTVGQVFRMNVWNDSWITTPSTATRPTRLCRTSNPCPPVALDAR